MTHGSPSDELHVEFGFDITELDTQFICSVCNNLETVAPGAEPPSPSICHTCNRHILAELLGFPEVWR